MKTTVFRQLPLAIAILGAPMLNAQEINAGMVLLVLSNAENVLFLRFCFIVRGCTVNKVGH